MAKKVTGKVKATVSKRPVKAGSTHKDNKGGIFNVKVVAIVNKKKK